MRKFFRGLIFVITLSALSGWLLYSISELPGFNILSDIIAGVDHDFYLKYYYESYNSEEEQKHAPKVNNNLVLVNINQSSDSLIAETIKAIASKEPAIIGIDKLFAEHHYLGPNPRDTDSLLIAINSIKSILIAPCHIPRSKADTLFPSYTKYLGNDFTFGSVRRRDYYSSLYSVDKRDENSSLLMFDYLMAEKSGLINERVKKNINNYHINFRTKKFETVFPFEIDDIDFHGKAVLMGDFDDSQDLHPTPFSIEQDRIISGGHYIAYAVSSMIEPEESHMSNDSVDKSSLLRPYRTMSAIDNILLSLALLFVFYLFFYLLSVWRDSTHVMSEGADRRKCFIHNYIYIPFVFLLVPFITIATEVGIIYISYLLTSHFCILPNLLGLMFSVFCISVFHSLFYKYDNK